MSETCYGLKDAWKAAFRVGAAVGEKILKTEAADKIICRHFSSLTPENAMKFGEIHPEENRWHWTEADEIANYARRLGIPLRGHTILWHNQTPPWLFIANGEASGKTGEPSGEPASKTDLFRRLENHIAGLTGRYNDVVYAWDVLNEVIDVETGSDDGFRLSKWYQIGGREIYDFAFTAMQAASPRARLFYNDYNIESGKKMEATIRFLSELLDAGVPVQGVGIQGHWYYNYPDAETLCAAIEAYSALGLDIEFTEVDISVYEFNEGADTHKFFTAMPGDRIRQQAERYKEIFRIAAHYPAVKNITTWGIADNHTWLDNFPVPGRKNWPLLFDMEYRHKHVVPALVETGLSLND
ncbi:beta-xylanase [Spirochaetia bacterium]|nr:beta-xylanase [Spirochaetia bacterium]